MKSRSESRTVHVVCETASGWRWLKNNARGATVSADGFVVTNEADWAESLRAAGGKEVP